MHKILLQKFWNSIFICYNFLITNCVFKHEISLPSIEFSCIEQKPVGWTWILSIAKYEYCFTCTCYNCNGKRVFPPFCLDKYNN